MILVVVLYALFGASILASKMILPYTKPIFLTGIRMFLAGIALLSYEYFHPHRTFRFHKEHIGYYLKLTMYGVYITYILRFWGLEYMPAFKMSFLFNFAPFLTSLYSYFIFKEKLSRKQWAGLSIGMLGLIPTLIARAPAEAQLGELFFISWPEIAVIFAVAFSSYSWIVMRTMVREHSYSPMMVNGITMTAGGFLALGTSQVIEGFAPITSFIPFFLILSFIVLVSNIICHNLYGHLLRSYSATFLSFAGFITPLFTALYERIILGTTITWHFYLSMAIVFVGLYLFYKDELRVPPLIK
jgi:drug/metabolite transporter (DMT)-like permease